MEKRHQTSALGFNILDLPPQILSDILCKLPVYSIFSCRCVCKTFRNLLTDSYFARAFVSRALKSPNSFVVVTERLRLFSIDCESLSANNRSSSTSRFGRTQNHSSSSTYKSGIDQIHCRNDVVEQKFTRMQVRLQKNMKLVNSCNGFLCLSTFDAYMRNIYCICNPVLGEFLMLPPSPSSGNIYLCFSAFGFDPESKQYKIIQLVPKADKFVAELYTLGENSWRVIENVSSSAKPKSAFNPSLNGALHWVTDSKKSSELIYSFDLHTDEFKPVSPPCHFDDGFVKKISWVSVGVLEGCLCLCYVYDGVLFEAWFMKDYGLKESWTRKFTIDIVFYCGVRLGDKHRPIGFTKHGDMWLKSEAEADPYSLISFSPKTGSFTVFDIDGITAKFEATPHVLSFISLKDIVNVSDVYLKFKIIRPSRN